MDFLACSDRSDVMLCARVVTLLHGAGTERSQALPSVGKTGIPLSSNAPYNVKLDWTPWTAVSVVCLFVFRRQLVDLMII